MVVRYLRSKRHPPPPNKSDEAIERHRTFLEDNIDPDFGLLDKLLAKGTLSSREILEVKDKSPYFKRNFQLLNYILEKHQGDRLIEALRDKEQRHIVNYLNRNGEYNPEYGEEWPLTAKEISILDTNQESLIELLDLSDLLGLLRSTKVINRRQMNFISSKPNSDDQTEALIGILRRRSLRDYQQTISCLRQSNQSQVADLLESGGVVARVHAHLDGLLEYVKQTEDAVVARFKSLQSKSVAEISRLFKFKVIAAKKGESIVLYIWCETVEELQDLQNNDQLKDSAEQLFHQLLTPSKKITVKDITLDDEEFERMKKYFTEPDKTEEKQKQEPDETKKEQKQEPDETEEKQKQEPDKTEEKQKQEPDKTEEKQKQEPDETKKEQKQEPDETEKKQKQEPDKTEEKQKQEPDKTEEKQKQEPDETKKEQKQEPDEAEEKQKQETEICYEEDPVLVKTIRTKAAEEFETGISGLAIADNVLFITTFHSNVIEVYDLKSLALSDRWPLNAAENPWDLGYCSRNKYLYVMDADLKYILKVDLNGKLFIMFSAGKGYGCISVTNDCNVLMADYEGNKITEYTSEGQIVLEIDLSASSSGGFVHPGHAIKLTDSRYLMSHGEGKDPLHRVCVVDRSGNIQMFFVVQRGSPFDRLFAPIYLAIDSNGSIFVIDRDKSRVLLLSSGLELIREIISTKKGIHNPERIALDQANGRLLLVHYDEDLADCRVSIFKIL